VGNNLFKNLISNTGTSGDCFVLQINKQTGEENIGFGKREMAWGPLTAIFVKYCGLVRIEVLEEIDKEISNLYHLDTEPIEGFLKQNLFFLGEVNNLSDYRLNSPLEGYVSFVKKHRGVFELHLRKYNENSNIRIRGALRAPEKQEHVFKEKIIYFPSDSRHLLEALIEESPYESETEYAIRRYLRS